MKKWLVALITLMISVAVCLGVACADSTTPDTTDSGNPEPLPIVSVMNGTLGDDGVYSGDFYYRVEFNLAIDANIDMGNGPIDADEPDYQWTKAVGKHYYDPVADKYYAICLPDYDNPEDAVFVRLTNTGEWTKLKFRYDTSKTNGPKAKVTNTIAPELNQTANYDITWTAENGADISGADAFYVHLETPDGRELPAYFAAGNSTSLSLGTGNRSLVYRYGEENLKNLFSKYGGYNIWIETLKDGEISESDRWYFYIPETAPVLMLNGNDNDPRYVQQNDDGSISIHFHQWVQVGLYAPGASKIDVYSLDSLENLEDSLTEQNKWVDLYFDPHSEGWYDFQWIRNWALGNKTEYDQYLVAVARYDESPAHDLMSEPMTIHVSMDREIDGEITYAVPDDVNTKENGKYQVARDGILYVDIDNNNNDADFYGLYIAPGDDATDFDQEWLADSHWFEKSEGTTTRVQLTVPRCVAGNDYQVRVFAIKFGAPQKEAETKIPIHVTEKAADPDTHELCPVTINMRDSYVSGEPLMVYAHYSNPDKINGWMVIKIHKDGDPDYIIHEKDGDFHDYWDMDSRAWEEGTYVVDAEIRRDSDGQPYVTYPGLKTFQVTASGKVADIHASAVTTQNAWQEMKVDIIADVKNNRPAPENYYVAVERVDGNGDYRDEFDVEANEDGTASFRIDGGAFQPGSVFVVTVNGFKYGYNMDQTQFKFVVSDMADDQGSQNLHLTINGKDNGMMFPKSSENLHIKLESENRPAAVRILNGDQWEYWYGDEDNFERDWGFGDGIYLVYAEATWDNWINFDELNGDDWDRQVNWQAKSNIIILNVDSPNGGMKAPEFTIQNTDTDLDWGEELQINIADAAPVKADGTVPDTENWFFLNFYKEMNWGEGPVWEHVNGGFQYDIHSGDNNIMTYNLDEGRYQVEIGADAVGYAGNASRKEFTIGKKPEQMETPAKMFTIEGADYNSTTQTYEMLTLDELRLTAYHFDAEWYSVEITLKDNAEWHDGRDRQQDGLLRDWWRPVQSGTYTLTAYAYRHDAKNGFSQNQDGEWQTVIGTQTVTVKVSHAEGLGAVQATLDTDWACVGEPITITFSPVAQAEEYSYWIHGDDDNNWRMGESRDSAGSFTIDTSRLERGVYQIELDMHASGYEESHATLSFALVEKNDYQPTEEGAYYFNCGLYYDKANRQYSAGTGDNFSLMYFVPGAEKVRLLDGYDTTSGYNENDHIIADRNGVGIQTWQRYNEPGETHYIFGKYEKNGTWSTPVQLCTIVILGRMNNPDVDMPMVVNYGDSVTFRFHTTDHAVNYSYWFALEGDEDNSIYGEKTITPETEKTVPAAKLLANRVYRFYFDVNAQGYMSGHTERLLYVLGNSNTEGITLNVPTQAFAGDTFHVTASAEGAQDIYIRWDTDNGDIRGRDGDDYIDEEYFIDNYYQITSSSTFTAFARVNDNQVVVTRATVAPATGTESADTAQAPSLRIDAEDRSVVRNGFIKASISSSEENVIEYHVNIFDKKSNGTKGDWRGDYHMYKAGDILIPTYNLPAGEYYIGAWIRVQGKYSASLPDNQMIPVTITESEGEFYVSKDRVQVCEPLMVSIYAPGAERIRFCGGNDSWWDDNGWDGDSWYNDDVKWEFSADEVEIYAEAMYNGEWREIGRRHITITKKGDLAEPKIRFAQPVEAGKALTITLDEVANGKQYGLNVRRLKDGWERWYEVNPDANDKLSLTIPADMLDEPNVAYELMASVLGTGYNAGVSDESFITVPAGLDTDKVISLTANKDNAQSNKEDVKFTVTAQGATVVKIYHEDQWEWAPTDENGKAEFNFGFNENRMQPVWATACYDQQYAGKTGDALGEVDWDTVAFTGMSNVVYIDVWSNGETWMPDWAEVPETVAWGDMLKVTIGEGGNAERFHIRIQTRDWQEIYFLEVYGSGDYYLPTTMLPVGFKGIVTIDGCCEGYTWNGMEPMNFRVKGVKEGYSTDNIYVTADKTRVFPYEPYHVIMNVPGAVKLKGVNPAKQDDVKFEMDGPQAVSNDCWWTENETGTQRLDVYAKYSENGNWSTDPVGYVELQVIDPQLARTVIGVDDVVDITEDINITIQTVPNGYDYELQMHQTDMENKYVFREKKTAEDATEGIITFTVPANELEANASYWIDCYVSAPGFQNSDTSKNIMTVSGTSAENNITLAMTGEWETDNGVYQIPIHTDFEVKVTKAANGTTPSAIAVYLGDRIEYRFFNGNEETVGFNEWQEWPETIFARAYYGDDIDGKEWEEVPWDKLAWGNATGIIKVNFFSEGQVGKPSFGAPGRITRGDDMYVNIFEVGDGADETHANISTNPPEQEENMVYGDDWQGWDPGRRQIRLETWMLNPGRYWLAVDNSGPRKSGNREWHEFEVYERLERPEILINSVVSNTGKTTIRVREVPNAQSYDLEIHLVGRNDEESYKFTDHKNENDVSNGFVFFTVPAGTLTDGGYWIDCHVNRDEAYFYGNSNSRMFVVRNNLTDTDDGITISADQYEVPINDSYQLSVSAPGAKAIAVRCGDCSRYYAGESVEDTFSESQPHIETMYAQACYTDGLTLPEDLSNYNWEGLTWGKTSNTITIRFTSEGMAGQAEFKAPETIVRGETMTIFGINPGHGANDVRANINRNPPEEPEDMIYGDDWQGWNPGTRTIYMPTAMLEPGTYWLAVDNNGIGYDNNRTWHQFTVTEPATPSGTITLSVPEKIQTGINAPISVYAPGATEITFAFDLEPDYDGNPDSKPSDFRPITNGETVYDSDNYSWNEAETHTIAAYAKFGDTWIHESATFTVCNPLSVSLLNVPGYYTDGQNNADITIPKPENADVIYVQVYKVEGDNWEQIGIVDRSVEDVTIRIPQEHLIAGRQIVIDYQAYATGFSDCNGQIWIPVIGTESGNGATLRLAKSLEDQTALSTENLMANDQFVFLVTPAEGKTITAVRFYNGINWWDDGNDITHENHSDWFTEDGSAFFFENYNEESNRKITAFAEVQVSGSDDWFRTNEISFTLKNNGTVGGYDFINCNSITVPRGTVVTVNFQAAEGAEDYWIDVFSTWDNRGWDPKRHSNGTTVWFSTINLQPGTYEIRGRAGATGMIWRESNSSVRLTVTEDIPSMPRATFVTPEMLSHIEEEAFAGIPAKVVDISSQTQRIDYRAFADSGVKTAIFYNPDTEIDDEAFAGCNDLVIYAPPYGSVQGWADWNVCTFYPMGGWN